MVSTKIFIAAALLCSLACQADQFVTSSGIFEVDSDCIQAAETAFKRLAPIARQHGAPPVTLTWADYKERWGRAYYSRGIVTVTPEICDYRIRAELPYIVSHELGHAVDGAKHGLYGGTDSRNLGKWEADPQEMKAEAWGTQLMFESGLNTTPIIRGGHGQAFVSAVQAEYQRIQEKPGR